MTRVAHPLLRSEENRKSRDRRELPGGIHARLPKAQLIAVGGGSGLQAGGLARNGHGGGAPQTGYDPDGGTQRAMSSANTAARTGLVM